MAGLDKPLPTDKAALWLCFSRETLCRWPSGPLLKGSVRLLVQGGVSYSPSCKGDLGRPWGCMQKMEDGVRNEVGGPGETSFMVASALRHPDSSTPTCIL